MKKFLLLTLIMCLFGGLSSSLMAQEVTIGSGTNEYNFVPIATAQVKSCSQTYYLSTEIGETTGGTIDKIAYYISTPDNVGDRAIRVYLRNAEESYFPRTSEGKYEMVNMTDQDQVFDGTISVNTAGWVTIDIEDFYYNGNNLLVTVFDNTNSRKTNTYFHSDKTLNNSQYRTIRKNGGSSDPTQTSIVTFTAEQYSPNIKLTFTSSTPVTPTLPDAPTLTSPNNGATDIFNPSLNFSLGNNTTHYQVLIAEANGTGAGDYTNLTSWIEKSSMEDFQTSHLKPATTYYWKVDVKNGEGKDAPTASSESYFTTKAITAAPGAITEVSPTDGASNLENPSLSWKFGENTEEFQLLFGQDPYNLKIVSSGEWENTKNTTELYTYTPSNLSSGTYYWQVKSRNTAGQDTYNTTTGDIYSFSVASIPDDITPIYPTDGATGISNNTTISWTFSSNTKQYRVLYYLTK